MSFADLFKFGAGASGSDELPEIFPLSVAQNIFVETEVKTIYAKILTDVVERTEGLDDKALEVLWDNCLASESSDGLVSLLAKAMFKKDELFIVLDKATGVLRKATNEEMTQIKADYKKQAESKVGVFISFKNYDRTDMIKVYSLLEFYAVSALNKTMGLAKAVQYKIADLRKSVSLVDSAEVAAQAKKIADNLAAGRDVYLDAGDEIVTANPTLEPSKISMELLNQKRAFYLNMPSSYITGILNGGLGDTGQADVKATERGLRGYFVSIIKPVCKALFNKDVTFKSEDFMQIKTNIEVLKTFEITSDELIGHDNKLEVINKLFGFPKDTKGDAPEKPDPAMIRPAPGAPGGGGSGAPKPPFGKPGGFR